MATHETIAALEAGAWVLSHLGRDATDFTDAATIRDHIGTLRNSGERAEVVALIEQHRDGAAQYHGFNRTVDRAEAFRAGQAHERAAIAAKLRTNETWKAAVNHTMAMRNDDTQNVCHWLAGAIERGTL